MDIRFSLAWDADFPILVDMQNRVFPSGFELDATIRNPEQLAAALRAREAFVYTINAGDEIIGNIIVREKGPGDFALGCCCVTPEHQGKGIGTKAMEFLEGAFSDATHWSVSIPASNGRGIRFCEQSGLRETGRSADQGIEMVTMEWSPPRQA